MKVLHVAESAMGGVGSYLAYLAPLQIDALGQNNVRILAPDAHVSQLGPQAASVATTFHRPGRSLGAAVSLAGRLQDEVRSFAPDIIHAHSTVAGVAARLLFGRRPDRPAIVYCPHGWAFGIWAAGWKVKAVTALERGLARWCDTIVAISRYEAEEASRIGIAKDQIRVVMNGVPDPPPTPAAEWRDMRLKVLFVGRFDRQKGFDVLMDAVQPLGDRVTVRAAGASVADAADAAALPDNVELLGWLDAGQVDAQMRAADVVVVPSRWEGFGLVAAEAMRAGKPVVASDVGALPEVVEHGVTGRLVPADHPVSLGRALLEDDAFAREAMGRRARQRYLDRFTATRMSDDIFDIYEQQGRAAAPVYRMAPAA